MGFVKGTDGIASTLRNTLEGSVGNIALENISAVTLTSTANVTGGNVLTGGIISATGNVSGGNLNVTGNIVDTGALSIITGSNGNIALAPNGTGIVTASGNISAVGNISGGNLLTAGLITATGNVTGGNVLTAGIVSATGNVTAANFFGNGNTLSNVATQVTGSWTVPVGNNTQSFTVPINNMYQLWVLGNIPNGIIVYNATVSVSNTNVPVVGQQFAWNYEGGGNILMFTSIPAQIVGTAGTISNAAPAVANTNVFTFGINNASGNTVTVNYGYTKIS